MNNKMKFSSRILLGYLVPCVIFTLAVVAMYLESLALERTIANMTRAVSVVENCQSLQRHVADLQRAARGSLLKAQDAQLENYETSKQQADQDLLDLKQLVQDAGQIAVLNRIADVTNAISDYTRRQIDRVKAGEVEQGVQEFRSGQSDVLYQSFTSLAAQFFEREKQIEEGLKVEVTSGIAFVNRIALMGLGLALAVSLVAGFWLARKTSTSLKELISVVAASSTQIAATTQEHEGAMTQQASAVTETTATVEEMVATARINAEQAEAATQSANEAQATTQSGLELVTHNEKDMAAMEATMNRIAEQIIGLSEQAGQIGEIARVVGELAAETNMLALNAAVEAARAGDQGKGFAVVASEIRKLADQSKKSAERANQIVADIQKATNGMVMTAEDGSKTTHSAAGSARLASQAFEKIIHLADAVYHNAQQVLLNSKQQAVALAQIDIAMKNINNGAREMSTGTAQIREGIARLSAVAVDINQML